MSSTTLVDEPVFGKLILQSREMPYAHFPHICELEKILNIMVEEWQLEYPKIMLLIISDNAPLQTWARKGELECFMKGLLKGSNATSMWIITNGLDTGIANRIGKALHRDFIERYSQICHRHAKRKIEVHKTPLIGICSEKMLTYSDQFKRPEKTITLVNEGNILEENKFNLNSHHTHFLIIQQRTYLKDVVNRFLLRLLDALLLSENQPSEPGKCILPESPLEIIAILIQGNTYTIHYVLAHLKRKLPVIIIKGSGGLADIFAYAYYEVRRSFQKIKDQEYVETVLRKGLKDKIISVFPSLKDNKETQRLLCARILECIKCAEPPEMKQITVLNVLDLSCNMEDLPSYTLQALFKYQKTEAINLHYELLKDLQLTIDWNCPEIALTKVFYRDPTFHVTNDMFETVLLERGREPFISIFLDNAFPIHKYLSATRLINLFTKVLKEDFFYRVIWEGVLGYEQIMKLDESFINNDLNWIIESLVGLPVFVSAEELTRNSAELFYTSYAFLAAKRKALIILLMWALISNRLQLALVLWRHTDQPIMTALVASLILDRMLIFISDKKTQEQLEEFSQKFASMATGVFDLCYNDIPAKAYDILNLRSVEWNDRSLIDIASLTKNRSFVAHPCCQKWLTNKFMGKIKIRDLTWGLLTFPVYIKVILCAFLVFPMYLWVRFKGSTYQEFYGENEYESSDPYYLSDNRDQRLRAPREDVGRSHLLKYHYPPLWQMIYWMWSAPITKFWVSNIFYIIYLAIFSLAVIWPSCGSTTLDSVICIWTCLIAFDCTYKLVSVRKAFPNTPVFASCLEIIYIIIFVIFLFLIRISDIEAFQDPYAGKVLICAGLIYFYYRMIFIYLPISSTLGPLLYQVKRMITVDFVNFMKLVVFILIANGIVMQSILYPDYPLIPELVRKSFHKAFISFFMTPVDELTTTDKNCVKWEQKPHTDTMCRVSDYVDGKCSDGIAFWPYVLVFHYVLLLKLILMTVLFALFNNTRAKIGQETDSIWKFQRYHLIVNFSNSLRLPPPLNIFSIILILYNISVQCCKEGLPRLFKKKSVVKKDKKESDEKPMYLSSAEYTYWRKLAFEYYAIETEKKLEETYIKKELDIITQLSEDLSMKENLISKARAQIIQLETNIYFTHIQLETLKYHTKTDITKGVLLHSLSRESPYLRTKIQRFPVSDKYVPWEVLWLHYEPSSYTMPKEDFPKLLQPYVDEDILLLQKTNKELPVYSWNLESVDANGVYRNRKSWIRDGKGKLITYQLDEYDLPRNPMGRTGLRGKGALPRWGPNHSVFVIITRWKKKTEKDESLMELSDSLEFVETWFMKKKDCSLPGGFAWSENKYQVVQTCFLMEDESEIWQTSDDMNKFFKDHAVGLTESENSKVECEAFSSKMICCGYMDDQLNTDQAWKEVELWHVHYGILNNLYRSFKANIRWKVLTEDVFIRLPYGQTILLQDVLRPLNAKVENM